MLGSKWGCMCLKSEWATIEIPELEFELSADGKRHTDSIYNHIASAVYNLGNCVSNRGVLGPFASCLLVCKLSASLQVVCFVCQ
jgi:hypothetical protein